MYTNRFRIPLLTITGVAAAISLAACSSSGGSTDNTKSSAASTPAVTGSAQQQPVASGKSVTATETEFQIALSSKTLSAGKYIFRVKNAGKITHALTVDGPGVKSVSTGDISPGSSKTLTVTLTAGSYDVFCPVGNHKMQGMDETVKVA